ncbi:MAG: gliding motility lipoprotein GldD [Hymenobacteraceae bacterium]|nr:gliding motility lipoprotein GldD [Hymenobacteraceae bacterium]
MHFSVFLSWLAYALVGLLMSATSCTPDYTPKPRGWNRIDLPRPTYRPLNGQHPYAFDVSRYARELRDSSRFAIHKPHWININYPRFKATIQLTYEDLHGRPAALQALIADARKLTSKHEIKASGIREQVLKTRTGLTADVFDLSGEVPSQFQFYVTDSARHFLRGALYFRTAVANDSLAPVIQYLRADAVQMLNTLRFKE